MNEPSGCCFALQCPVFFHCSSARLGCWTLPGLLRRLVAWRTMEAGASRDGTTWRALRKDEMEELEAADPQQVFLNALPARADLADPVS